MLPPNLPGPLELPICLTWRRDGFMINNSSILSEISISSVDKSNPWGSPDMTITTIKAVKRLWRSPETVVGLILGENRDFAEPACLTAYGHRFMLVLIEILTYSSTLVQHISQLPGQFA